MRGLEDWCENGREREKEGGRGNQRVHSRSPFCVWFGLKRGRSCWAECMQSWPVGRGGGGKGREGEVGVGQGWDVIHMESCQTERQSERKRRAEE